VVGFAVAAELVLRELAGEIPRQSALRDVLESSVMAACAGVRVAAASAPRLPNLTAMLVDGASTEALIAALDIAGVEVSGGSACTSGAVRESHVLQAIGVDAQATALIRCSLGRGTTAAEVDRAAAVVTAAVRTATGSAAALAGA
jgi:cysteine desulfurase